MANAKKYQHYKCLSFLMFLMCQIVLYYLISKLDFTRLCLVFLDFFMLVVNQNILNLKIPLIQQSSYWQLLLPPWPCASPK